MTASKNRFPVLRAYFKVLKKSLPSFWIYLVAFLSLSVMMTIFNKVPVGTSFEQTKYPVVFNDSDNTAFSDGLKDYLSEYCTFETKYTKKSDIQDAMFSHAIYYVATIPKGFTDDFLTGGDMQIERSSGQQQDANIYMDLAIKNYLKTAKTYALTDQSLTPSELATKTKESLAKTGDIKAKSFSTNGQSMTLPSVLFTFTFYGIINIIFLGISSIMIAFNKKELQNRLFSSTLKPLNYNLQIFSGHLIFTFAVFIICCLLPLAYFGTSIVGPQYFLMCLNLLCVCVAVLSLSFLISQFVKSSTAQNGITNVLSLGLSLISGVFVPQYMLNESLLNVSRFTPAYWYVKNCSDIAELSDITQVTLSPIFTTMLIQIGFAVALLAVALVISKTKHDKNIA